MTPNYDPETTSADQRVRGLKWARQCEGVQRPLRGFERGPDGSNSGRPTGESNPIAWPKPEARHRSRASFQMHACIDSSAAAAARQMRDSHGFHTQGTCGSHRRTSRARECGHFGAGLVLWLQELEESEASVHAIMSDPAYIWEIQSDLVEIQLADRRRGHSNSVLRGQV